MNMRMCSTGLESFLKHEGSPDRREHTKPECYLINTSNATKPDNLASNNGQTTQIQD